MRYSKRSLNTFLSSGFVNANSSLLHGESLGNFRKTNINILVQFSSYFNPWLTGRGRRGWKRGLKVKKGE
jgi:hypothetical protein